MIRPGIECATEQQTEVAGLIVISADKLIARNREVDLIIYDGHSSDQLVTRAHELSIGVVDKIDEGLTVQQVEALQRQYKELDRQFGREPKYWGHKKPDFVCSRLGRKTLQFALGEVNRHKAVKK